MRGMVGVFLRAGELGGAGEGERRSEKAPAKRRATVEAMATVEMLVAGELEAGMGCEDGG